MLCVVLVWMWTILNPAPAELGSADDFSLWMDQSWIYMSSAALTTSSPSFRTHHSLVVPSAVPGVLPMFPVTWPPRPPAHLLPASLPTLTCTTVFFSSATAVRPFVLLSCQPPFLTSACFCWTFACQLLPPRTSLPLPALIVNLVNVVFALLLFCLWFLNFRCSPFDTEEP